MSSFLYLVYFTERASRTSDEFDALFTVAQDEDISETDTMTSTSTTSSAAKKKKHKNKEKQRDKVRTDR